MRLKNLIAISCCFTACGALIACNASSSDDAEPGAGGDHGSAGTSSSTGGTDSGSAGEADEGVGGAEPGAGGADAECEVDATYMPSIDPADFVEGVDNPYWPLVPGTRWVFEGGGEYVEVEVTDMTKEILGIPVVVVRDTVRDGAVDAYIVEDTYDWYAQDKDGNVWYMGEDTKEYDANGMVISTEGSWEAGVDGAQPGIVMYATPPAAGEPYRQEYYACQAEDYAEIMSPSEAVSVPFGDFEDCIQTREFTPLELDVNEHKYYCAGIGLVLEVDVPTGDRIELTQMIVP